MNLEGKIGGYNKKTLVSAGLIVVIALGMFYIGAEYEKGKLSKLNSTCSLGKAKKSSKKHSVVTPSANAISGTITAKDDKTVTLKMADGTTKIVDYTAATTVGKNAKSTIADLVIGEEVTVSGQPNADGTFAADNIQKTKTAAVGTSVNSTPAATPASNQTSSTGQASSN